MSIYCEIVLKLLDSPLRNAVKWIYCFMRVCTDKQKHKRKTMEKYNDTLEKNQNTKYSY